MMALKYYVCTGKILLLFIITDATAAATVVTYVPVAVDRRRSRGKGIERVLKISSRGDRVPV
jgi:hypothetical protein